MVTPPSLVACGPLSTYIEVVSVTANGWNKEMQQPEPLIYLIGTSQPIFGGFADLTFGGAGCFGGWGI